MTGNNDMKQSTRLLATLVTGAMALAGAAHAAQITGTGIGTSGTTAAGTRIVTTSTKSSVTTVATATKSVATAKTTSKAGAATAAAATAKK
jgi:hypothetical protein